MRTILLTALLVLFGSSVVSEGLQAQRDCGAMDYLEQQMQNDPKRAVKMQQIELQTRQFMQNRDSRAVNGVITIPVVVHIVYNNNAENISDAQIQTQIDVLNEDFRRQNSDADGTWSQAADSEIEFCMATVDPNGASTTGITRTSTTRTSFGTNDDMKFNSRGGKDAWPAGDYLNMWVCDISGGILGYAQFPGGPASTDGVVMDYQYFGTIGTATAPFDLGRTATHEVGHWLNLRHIWGDGGCSVDDAVGDTPTSDAANYGCATGHVSCGSTDMVQNYMDYSDDACMNLYTEGQKTRMRALFDNGGFRESLLTSSACGAPQPPSCDDGQQNGNETGVDCGGPDCPACPPCTDVTVSITLDNYPEETSWTITDANGTTIASGGTYGSQPDGSTVTEVNCLVDGCYDFTINDSYGDGICCSYGNGSYSVTVNGTVVASGSQFGSSETTNFCVGGTAPPTCNDGEQNGNETGVDCGGPDCDACPTCNDGEQNGNETGVDCGGPDCDACPTCNDGEQNGNETGIDCGGTDCAPCSTCSDGEQNGSETGVDCGGPDCQPCTSCTGTEVTVSITLDNYPEETSWTITDANGTTIASGGTYGSQPDGSTVTDVNCLADGCYDFTINDTYGDGICCAYGNGSYIVTDDAGNTLASGSNFGSSETTTFCLGDTNPPGPTCGDGEQNGNETGIDCGGPDCPPCDNGGGCVETDVDSNDFEAGFGIWNDGGSDCRRSINDQAYANSGSYCIRLRDDTNSSTVTTDDLALSGFEEITIDFSYYPRSMENGEDFWLQVSLNGGATYQTEATWARGADFNNNIRYFESVTISDDFTNNTHIRFRCDASGNSDWIYLDDIVITGCANNTRQAAPNVEIATIKEAPVKVESPIGNLKLAPNPTRDWLQLNFDLQTKEAEVTTIVTDMTGRTIERQVRTSQAGPQQQLIDMSQQVAGIYLIHVISGKTRITEKFVVID